MKLAIMDSVQLLANIKKDKFKEFVSKSYIAVISDNITTDGTHPNTINMNTLMPQQGLINILQSGNTIEFGNLYAKYLQTPAISVVIMGLFNRCMADKKNLILLCSEDEDRMFGYLETLGFFLAASYNIEPVPLKKIVKGKTDKYEADNEAIKETIGELYERAVAIVPDVMSVVDELLMSDEQRKKLEKKRRKEEKKKKNK